MDISNAERMLVATGFAVPLVNLESMILNRVQGNVLGKQDIPRAFLVVRATLSSGLNPVLGEVPVQGQC